MDGATLTVKLQDESVQGAGSPATTPQGGSSVPTSSHVEDQQRAITQAGGVGRQAEQQYSQATTTSSASAVQPSVATAASVPVATPLPTPVSTASQPNTESALAQAIQKIVSTDPSATAEEIAKLLGGGIGARQVESMMSGQQAPPPPPATPIPTPPATPIPATPSTPDDTDVLIRRERRLRDEAQDNERRRIEAGNSAEQQLLDEVATLTRRERRGGGRSSRRDS